MVRSLLLSSLWTPVITFGPLSAVLLVFQVPGRQGRGGGVKKRSKVRGWAWVGFQCLTQFRSICGTLHSVDQYLNIKLTEISVTDTEKYPHMVSIPNLLVGLLQSILSWKSEVRVALMMVILEVVSKKLLHQRLSGKIRAAARGWGRHAATAGCCQERGICTYAID